MKNKNVVIPLDGEKIVSGIVSVPDGFEKGKGSGIIVAHGAGKGMSHPLLVSYAEGLATAGYLSMRFNFPYMEKGKRVPDPPRILEQAWISAYAFFQNESGFPPGRIFAAGKSMGGRIASQLVADGILPVSRLILLGYPLHPPGRKEKLRDSHLYDIDIPMLFFAGTRDSLCDLPLLKRVLKKLKTSWALEIIDGGDHSFKLPKSSGITELRVYERVLDKTLQWLQEFF